MIYYIAEKDSCGKILSVKIGYSNDPALRIKNLKTGNKNRLEIIAQEPGGTDKEALIHNLFDHIRSKEEGAGTEWFDYTEELSDYIKKVPIRVRWDLLRLSFWDGEDILPHTFERDYNKIPLLYTGIDDLYEADIVYTQKKLYEIKFIPGGFILAPYLDTGVQIPLVYLTDYSNLGSKYQDIHKLYAHAYILGYTDVLSKIPLEELEPYFEELT